MLGLMHILVHLTAVIGNGIKHTIDDTESRNEAIRKGKDCYYDHTGTMTDLKTGHHMMRTIDDNGDTIIKDLDNGRTVRNYSKEIREKQDNHCKEIAKRKGEIKYYAISNELDIAEKYNIMDRWWDKNIDSKGIYGDLNNPNKYYVNTRVFDELYMVDISNGQINLTQPKDHHLETELVENPITGKSSVIKRPKEGGKYIHPFNGTEMDEPAYQEVYLMNPYTLKDFVRVKCYTKKEYIEEYNKAQKKYFKEFGKYDIYY